MGSPHLPPSTHIQLVPEVANLPGGLRDHPTVPRPWERSFVPRAPPRSPSTPAAVVRPPRGWRSDIGGTAE